MKNTFNYTPSGLFAGRLTNLGLALFLIVCPFVLPFGIRIGRMRILGPNGVAAIFIIGGILLLIFTVLEIRKARILAARGGMITVDDDTVTYPRIEKGEVKEGRFRISAIEWIKYDEEENECEIRLADESVKLRSDFFDDRESYEAFRNLLGK